MISQLDWTERIVVAAGKRMAATGSLTAEFDERSGGDALRWRTAVSGGVLFFSIYLAVDGLLSWTMGTTAMVR